MITLLKPGYEKIMSLFYHDKSIKLHLREIARRANLHEPSTSKFLNNLEKEKILKSEKEANLKKYSVKNNSSTYLVFEIFDIDKLNNLKQIRKDAINYYLNNLKEKPIFAVLFGSTAKQTYKEDSDIDILIITNNKIEVKEAEKESNQLTGIKISTFQITYKEFIKELKLKEDKVIQSALNTGYPLLNHIQYYEVLNNERI